MAARALVPLAPAHRAPFAPRFAAGFFCNGCGLGTGTSSTTLGGALTVMRGLGRALDTLLMARASRAAVARSRTSQSWSRSPKPAPEPAEVPLPPTTVGHCPKLNLLVRAAWHGRSHGPCTGASSKRS